MKESRIKFIKRAHESACSDWKTEIENEFPKLFPKIELEVGKWYKAKNSTGNHLICLLTLSFGNNHKGSISHAHCGFCDADWINTHRWDNTAFSEKLTPATDKEVEKALIKEAKRRYGDNEVKCNESGTYKINFTKGVWEFKNNKLCLYSKGLYGVWVFDNGKWAEIIQTITKEEAEKLTGKTIVG